MIKSEPPRRRGRNRKGNQPSRLNRNNSQNDTWVFLFLLHNLHIEGNGSFESDYLAICSGNDPRLPKSTQGNYGRTVRKFINSFQGNSGKSYLPAVMIVKKKFRKLPSDAFRAFRNIAAIATVAPVFAYELLGKGQWKPKWMDFFDFYPRTIGKDGLFVSLDSPVNEFGCLLPKFRGQCSPHISSPESFMLTPDTELFFSTTKMLGSILHKGKV